MINTWGDSEWGIDYWGSEVYNVIPNDRNITTVEQSWDSSIEIGTGSNMQKLIRALLSQANRIDAELEEVYEQQHINSATGKNLDHFGELINVSRNGNEPRDKYRARIKAEFAQSRIGTDFNSFTEFCASILNTQISNIEFSTNYAANAATVVVSANPSIYTSSSLNTQDVSDLLSNGVPAGHEVVIQEAGTFRLKSDGESDTASNGLTSDSIETGGTLAADLT